jgi:tight adherence protein C
MSGWWTVTGLAAADAVLWTLVCRTSRSAAPDRRLWAHVSRAPVGARRITPLVERIGAATRWVAVRFGGFGGGARRRRDADLLMQAGLEWDPPLLDIFRLAGAAVGLAAGMTVGRLGHLSGGLVGWTALTGGAGFLAPTVWVRCRGAARSREFRRALPDALDVLVICLRAGLGIQAAVAEYAGSASGMAGEAFRRYLADLALGRTPEDGLAEMTRRYPGEDLAAVMAGLAQAINLGSPLAEVLEEQAAHLRTLALRRAEEAARRLSARLVLPLVAFIFPQVFIIGLGPVVLRLLGPGGLLR